jgi:predicted transcriptional regulator of viral defense system
MVEKNYLTKDEQRLWACIGGKGIVDSELAAMAFPDMPENKRDKIMHSLQAKGYLRRARKGLYYNPEVSDSFYRIALRMRPGYIGFASALKLHNLLEYEDFTIFVATRDYRGMAPIGGSQYSAKFIPLGRLFTGFEEINGIRASSVEKTLFDCLLKPGLAGFPAITKALYDASIDWKAFLGFFKLTDNSSMCQRTGYILKLVKGETGLKVPDFVFIGLRKRVGGPAKLTPFGGRSSFDKEWQIQDNIGREKILSWWR